MTDTQKNHVGRLQRRSFLGRLAAAAAAGLGSGGVLRALLRKRSLASSRAVTAVPHPSAVPRSKNA